MVLVALPGQAVAQRGRDVSIGFYLQEAGGSLVCRNIQPLACSDQSAVVTGKVLQDYFAVACVFNGSPKDFNPQDYGISGVEFGIDYDGSSQSGVDITGWTICANGLEIASDDWPQSGSGNIITWIVDRESGDGCQDNVPGNIEDGVTAVIGFFTLTAYSTDRLSIIPNRTVSTPALQITTCPEGIQYDINATEQAGYVGFSSDLSEKGLIPCVHHVGETTWGRIKSTYSH
jgi:hypothetical protein